jgi:subfamily B ATP-binding cassette protein MsbA
MSLPATTAFLVLLLRAQPYAQVVSKSRVGIAAARKSLSEVEWLMAQKPAQRVSPTAIDTAERVVEFDRPIRFEQVDFTFPNGNRALDSISLSIKPGISTALIGRSGSGKTTIVNLLVRLLEPADGAIKLGDQDIGSIDIDAWRSQIAIAGQDIELVDGTIAQNIAYARPDATNDEIMEVARTAGAADFIERLPQGFDTEVGEEGINLSGGQRQRISLARALLRRPSLLILDEAMNAVDAMTETEIMKLLGEHRHFRTALVVSHRKSTLAACQEGIVIEEGRIREAGPLASLEYFRHMSGEVGEGS